MVRPTSAFPHAYEVLPTLDLRRFSGDTEERAAFLAELQAAARGPGFFYVTGHGIPRDFIGKVRDVFRAFFALPEADKLSIAMVNSPHFRGYNRAGLEHTRGKPDWREQIDIGTEQAALPLGPGAALMYRHGRDGPGPRRLTVPRRLPDPL